MPSDKQTARLLKQETQKLAEDTARKFFRICTDPAMNIASYTEVESQFLNMFRTAFITLSLSEQQAEEIRAQRATDTAATIARWIRDAQVNKTQATDAGE